MADSPGAAPQPPSEGECCGNGCERCVWTLYREALESWRLASIPPDEQKAVHHD